MNSIPQFIWCNAISYLHKIPNEYSIQNKSKQTSRAIMKGLLVSTGVTMITINSK
jgi:hypothetical protein